MCEPCDTAREYPTANVLYCPSCIYCGARLIQRIGRLPIAVSEATTRRREVLADWVKLGHKEAEIRTLVKGPRALAPESSKEQRRSGV